MATLWVITSAGQIRPYGGPNTRGFFESSLFFSEFLNSFWKSEEDFPTWNHHGHFYIHLMLWLFFWKELEEAYFFFMRVTFVIFVNKSFFCCKFVVWQIFFHLQVSARSRGYWFTTPSTSFAYGYSVSTNTCRANAAAQRAQHEGNFGAHILFFSQLLLQSIIIL